MNITSENLKLAHEAVRCLVCEVSNMIVTCPNPEHHAKTLDDLTAKLGKLARLDKRMRAARQKENAK